MKRLSYFIPLIILLAATALRFYQLDAQSLWNDEGSSYVQATRSFQEIAINAAADIHPPGYYWALKLWRAVVGDSEFALRALSAMAGVLTVAFTFAIGVRLWGRTRRGLIIGAVAAALVALNTFQIYYSQEMRMYAALALWATAGMWALIGFFYRPNGRSGLLLGLFNALGLWTQYAFPLVMLVQGVLALLWLAERERVYGIWAFWRGFGAYVLANLLALALFAPLLPTALRQVTTWPNTGDQTPLVQGLGVIVGWLTFGMTYAETNATWVAVALLLALWSLRSVPQKSVRMAHAWRTLLPVLWAALPPGIFLAAGLFREGNLKFLLPSQVGFALAIGAGAAAIWGFAVDRNKSLPRNGSKSHQETTLRAIKVVKISRSTWILTAATRIGVLLALLGLFWNVAVAIPPLYRNPAYQRNDYRSIVKRITPQLDRGDAVILNAPGQIEVFNYYYRGNIAPLPIPRGVSSSDAEIRTDVENAIANADDIFVVLWGEAERDPRRVVESILDEQAYEVGNTWYGDVRLARYVTEADWFEVTGRPAAEFGEHITLEAYAISEQVVAPGGVIQIRLTWRTDTPLTERYKVFIQLLDENGQLVAQRDAEPGGGLALTSTWPVDEAVEDNHALQIPEDIALSNYRLIMGLYNPAQDGVRLPIITPGRGMDQPRDTLTLTTIRVTTQAEAE